MLSVLTLVAVTNQSPVFAQTATVQSARCTIAEKRVELRITRAETVRTAQSTAYTTIINQLENIATSSSARGYENSAIVAAKTLVQTKAQEFADKAQAYETALSTVKNVSCGDSDGAFANRLTEARTALSETRAAAIAVRAAIKESAVPALNSYATWLKTQNDQTQGAN